MRFPPSFDVGSARVLALAVLSFFASRSHAQLGLGTAFTYQGSLVDGAAPANGNFDFEFSLHDDPTAPAQVGATLSFEAGAGGTVVVTKGVFTVALDFGAVFDGGPRYLEIRVRPEDPGDTAPYTTLSPRVPIRPVPYAIFAETAGSANAIGGLDLDALDVRYNRILTVATLTANPSSILGGSVLSGIVRLDLSTSTAFDGGALEYGFDPDSTIFGPPPFSSSPTLDHLYTTAATAEGWVRDSLGDVAFDMVDIDVVPGGGTTVIGHDPFPPGSFGPFSALLMAAGRPLAICFHESPGVLVARRAADDAGSTWDSPVNVQFEPDLDRLSAALVAGNPALLFRDTTESIRYARAFDAEGSGWTPSASVASGTIYSNLADVGGLPAIAWKDTGGAMILRRCDDVAGFGGWDFSLILVPFYDATHVSLAMVSGRPAVAFRESASGDLRYLRADDAAGTSWPTAFPGSDFSVLLDSTGDTGFDPCMLEVDGRPAVAYRNGTDGDLRFVRANDAEGSAWGTPVVVDGSANDVGTAPFMTIVSGVPCISYHDATNLDVLFARASDASGSVWSPPVTVDGPNAMGTMTSIADVQGFPALLYHDATDGSLKFAR